MVVQAVIFHPTISVSHRPQERLQDAMQNTSHAVMAQRHEPLTSQDDFPTPPWATRALVEHVLGTKNVQGMTCLEPACGRGHMASTLEEYFEKVSSFDISSYGYAGVRDFLTFPYEAKSHQWVITNPPFRLAEEFVDRAFTIATDGIAILARTVFLESVGRYARMFRDRPPSVFAQFTERVPMVKGRVDPRATTATGYAWFIWNFSTPKLDPRLSWIPPCRKRLERPTDYQVPVKSRVC